MYRVYPPFATGPRAVGLLGFRLVMGAAFVFHGWYKIQSAGGPFAWMGPESAVPGVFQGLAVLAEFGGGLALIAGFLTPLAALGVASTMVVALAMVHLPHGDPFVGKPGSPSFEPAAVYLAAAVMFLLNGPGVLSLDWLLFGRRSSTPAAGTSWPVNTREAVRT